MSIKNLVIVESPAKAKTIEKFLGENYTVTSSVGHVRDLPKSEMAIDIENGFHPKYVVNDDKKKVVSDLKKLAKDAENVLLATDEDREGEAIAWHLYEALDLKKKKNVKRIVFHEITKNALLEAIQNPRDLDLHLVDAQQARRVLDRLVGYELSPVLWKKVQRGLSAGRVQSVAVRVIVEQERAIENFVQESYFKVSAIFNLEGKQLKAEYADNFADYDEAKKFLESLINADYNVASIDKKEAKKSPAPPFTTSTLQQEASRKLGFSVKQTMTLAQKLYETGQITYMRTDSLNLSEFAIKEIANHISGEYGSKYSNPRRFKTKSAGAQEAHEAIRPTNFATNKASGDSGMQKLYDLIRKRTLASQMAEAIVERTNVKIETKNAPKFFSASGEVLLFDGFLKVYMEGVDDDTDEQDDNKLLPPMSVGQKLENKNVVAKQTFKRPPSRYTEASLVKKLEEMGIGRPSTYAPTISTIIDRKYVVKEDREGYERDYFVITLQNNQIDSQKQTETTGAEKSKLFPTDVGTIVTDFLVKNFEEVVDFQFTAKVEEEFDEIADGKKKWSSMIGDFYLPFKETIIKSEDISRQDAIQQRLIGEDPKTGRPIYARLGRFGPMLQIGNTEDEEKPKFASLLEGQRMDTITLEEALKQFDLPRKLGFDNDGQEILVQIGRFGPYLKKGSNFVSIPKDAVYSITLEDAIQMIIDKEKAKAASLIHNWEDEGIKVQIGRYGPYITDGKKNVKIPKGKTPEELTLEECKKIISEAPEKTSKRAPAKKTPARKPAAKKAK